MDSLFSSDLGVKPSYFSVMKFTRVQILVISKRDESRFILTINCLYPH